MQGRTLAPRTTDPMAGVFSIYTGITLGRSVSVDEASNVPWGHDTAGGK